MSSPRDAKTLAAETVRGNFADLVARAEAAEAKLSALQEEVGRLREALEPFAAFPTYPSDDDDFQITGRLVPNGSHFADLHVADFRRARSALARTAGGKDD